MKNVNIALHNIFIAVGFGTMVYVPMLLIDKGLNDTMQSVLTWVFASALYGLSFELLKIKSIYSYVENGKINVLKTVAITIPIFVVVYIALFLFMKYIGSVNK